MQEVLYELEKTWKSCPDLRFGQLIMDIVPDENKRFYMEDAEFVKAIHAFRKNRGDQ